MEYVITATACVALLYFVVYKLIKHADATRPSVRGRPRNGIDSNEK